MRFSPIGLVVLATLGGCATPPATTTLIPPKPAVVKPRTRPVNVDIPKIGAHSTLIPLGLNPDGTLQVPDVHHPEQAGYYCVTTPDPARLCSAGVIPGQSGPAVIAGHVDGDHHEGVFYRLKDLTIGDTFTVGEADGTTLTFQVYRIEHVSKTSFPSQLVYGDTVGPEVRLVTCGGPFIGGQAGYRDNLLVFATLIPAVP